jgi:WD40 repeat protein
MCVTFSPDGKLLAWGTIDGKIELWDAGGKRRISVLRGHDGAVVSVAFSPGGKKLASVGNDSTVRIWDAPLSER